MIYIVYHLIDSDGWASGALLAHYADKQWPNEKITFIPINYGLDFRLNEIQRGSIVLMGDYTPEKKYMDKLVANNDVYWFDHHKTSIEACDSPNIKGIRRYDKSGAGLVYEWIGEINEKTTFVIDCISNYDNHNMSKDWDTTIMPVHSYIAGIMPDPVKIEGFMFWNDLFTGTPNKDVDADMVTIGSYLLRKELNESRLKLDVYGVQGYMEVDGIRYSAIMCNGLRSSYNFHNMIKLKDIAIGYYVKKDMTYSISLYSEKVDTTLISSKFGGGGHKGASGCKASKITINNGLITFEK